MIQTYLPSDATHSLHTLKMRIESTIVVKEEPNLHLPRILCLHGGGTNARIFRAQCRGIVHQLKNEFRFVFAQAPFSSPAGPDVLSVYSQWGPFRCWLPSSRHPQYPTLETVTEVDKSLEDVMTRDDLKGATGEWVAVLGFSQGAKLAASLLYRQQEGRSSTKFRFGVLLAGSAPLVLLDQDWEVQSIFKSLPRSLDQDPVLNIPTIHMHGLRDEGIHRHRKLFESCTRDTSRLIEWDGDHRVPIKSRDVGLLVHQMRELAGEMDARGTRIPIALDLKPLISCLEVEVEA
jgi:predicted esterase